MAVVSDLQSWADNLELVRLPSIEADIVDTATLLNQKVQEFSDQFAAHTVQIASASADRIQLGSEILATTTQLYNYHLGSQTYTDAAIQRLRDELNAYVDGAVLAAQGDYTAAVNDAVNDATIALQTALQTALTEAEQVRSDVVTQATGITSAVDTLLTEQLPPLNTILLDNAGDVQAINNSLASYFAGISAGTSIYDFVGESISASTSLLGSSITEIKALNIDELSGTALGTFLTQLDVSADGTSATVTNQGAAIIDLEGYVTGTASLVAETSNGLISGIRASVYDGAGGGVTGSLLELLGDNVIAEGTLSASRMVIADFSGNLIGNGSFAYGDLRGWGDVSSQASAATFSNRKCLAFAISASEETARWMQDVPVTPGEDIAVHFYGATSTGGSATMYMQVSFYDAAGAYLSEYTSIGSTFADTAWVHYSSTQSVYNVPDGAVIAQFKICRGAGGAGTGYVTGIEVTRRKPGTTLITPNSITTTELNVAGDISALGLTADSLDVISANLGTIQVGYANIQDGAVTNQFAATTTTSMTPTTSYQTVQELTIDCDGNPVSVTFSATVGYYFQGKVEIRVDGSLYRTIDFNPDYDGFNTGYGMFEMGIPRTGTYSTVLNLSTGTRVVAAKLKIGSADDTGQTPFVKDRFLQTLELKR